MIQLTVAYDEGGYAVTVFEGEHAAWTGKAEYLEEWLFNYFKVDVIYGARLFPTEEWDWKDAYTKLSEVKE